MAFASFSIRPLPLILVAGAGILAVNAANVVTSAPWGVGAAQAADAPAATGKTPATGKPAAQPAGAKQGAAKPAAPAAPQSRVEAQLMDDIASRRTAFDERQKQLEMRERLMEATEKRVEAKIAELKALEGRLKQLTAVQEDQANKQFASLVKVYETMKPKDAAPIFQKLDMPVQIAVATRMKEAKMAAILSAMNPDSAKALTMALAERAKLPS